MIIALAGGVGGSRLAHGLSRILSPKELSIVVNTGDDFEYLGLHISPDPDTMLYTLSGLADRERGWGQENETWNFMAMLTRLGCENWFALGDKDLALHIERTRRIRSGESLSQVTQVFAQRLGISHSIVPMSDDPVRTLVHTPDGVLTFQDYFVRRRCEPSVRNIEFAGAGIASPSPNFLELMHSPDLTGIVFCPSNPVLSIDPILAVVGVRTWLKDRRVPAVAVCPIIGGKAVKGPAAKIMRELGMEANVRGVAQHYRGLIDGMVIDRQDVDQITTSEELRHFATNALMLDEKDRTRLAEETLRFLVSLSRQ